MMHAITEDTQTVQEEAQKIMKTACETQELRDQRLHNYEMKAAKLLDVHTGDKKNWRCKVVIFFTA